MMSTLLCSGNNNKTDRNHRSASSSSSSIIVDDAIGASSALNVSTPNACTGDCRLFQEIPEDLPDRRPLQDAEQLLAKDLNQVSHQERQDALHDIHGVSDLPDESPAFVARCQNDLELYLIRNQKRSAAFQTVWNTGAHHIDYIRSLYLLFLRCDAFDIAKAGQRIYLHFDTKLTLFGQDKLGRDITLNDFDAHDMDCYKAGFFQILPVRDRAGRAICIKLWKLQKFHCRENVWRQMWYNHMVVLQDEETQRRGLVQIIYNVNEQWKETFDKELYMGVGKIRAATPVRVVSVHYCFNDPAFGVIIKLVSLALEMHTRTRVRLHYGSDVEVQYELQGFGIPLRSLPVKSDGTFRLKDHASWITARRAQEASKRSESSVRIVVPTHADVLFGKGNVLQSHIGNLRFSNILEDELDRYIAAKRAIKIVIAKEVVARIAQDGGRFLRQDKFGVWEQVDEQTAIDKVGHGFRNRKPAPPRKKATASSTQTSNSISSVVEIKRPVSPSDESSTGASSSHTSILHDTAVSHTQNVPKRSKFNDLDKINKEESCNQQSPIAMSAVSPLKERTAPSKTGRFQLDASVVAEESKNRRLPVLPEAWDDLPLDLEGELGEFSSHELLDDLTPEINI